MVTSWKEHIVEEVYNVTKWNGHQYALPTYVDMAPFLAYNLDHLEDAGLSGPPENWSELKEYASKLSTDNRAGIALQATQAPVDVNIFEGIAFNNGGRFLDEANDEIVINKQGFRDALQLYVDLVEAGDTNGNLTEDNFKVGATLFAEQQASMWVGMSWLITPWFGANPEGLRWEGTAFPRPESPSGNYEPAAAVMDPTAALMVTTSCENPHAAMKYLDFWAQPEQLNLWGGKEEIARVPAGKEAYEKERLKEVWPKWVELYNKGELFDGAVSVPRFLGITQAEPELAKAIQKAILMQEDPQTALDTAAKNAQENYDILHE
jgi:ABC-type glycerol-3-phosphate transport system substrate-binding protein